MNEHIKVTSSVFPEGGMIPQQYTCDGANLSPPLSLSGLPAGTASLALLVEDPDAPRGTFTHWVAFNLPPVLHEVPERAGAERLIQGGGLQGKNDFGKPGYGGPCPPSGTHRYYFKVYALDTVLNLDAGASKDQLLHAMKGHVLAEGQLMGRYHRGAAAR